MRAGIAILAGSVLLATPAMARVTHEEAFNLCIAQPVLQTDSVASIVDDMLSKPHNPAMDGMSRAQIINAIQYMKGNECAAAFEAHPDAFAVVAVQKQVSDFAWEIAWGAVNMACRDHLSGACIRKEVDAAAAIRAANTQGGGQTPASRAWSLVLTSSLSFSQWKACMDAVGDQHPDDGVMLGCASSVRWHSQTDGTVAGRKLAACFKKGG